MPVEQAPLNDQNLTENLTHDEKGGCFCSGCAHALWTFTKASLISAGLLYGGFELRSSIKDGSLVRGIESTRVSITENFPTGLEADDVTKLIDECVEIRDDRIFDTCPDDSIFITGENGRVRLIQEGLIWNVEDNALIIPADSHAVDDPNLDSVDMTTTDNLNGEDETNQDQISEPDSVDKNESNSLAQRNEQASSLLSPVPEGHQSEETAKQFVNSTVQVRAYYPETGDVSIDSLCTAIMTGPGQAVTANHCVDYIVERLKALLAFGYITDNQFLGEMSSIRRDVAHDIAVVQLGGFEGGLAFSQLGNSDDVKNGQTVFFANYQAGSNSIVSFRGVVVGRIDDGTLIIATGIDNSTEDNVLVGGASGEGITDINGNIVGMASGITGRNEAHPGMRALFDEHIGALGVDPNSCSQLVYAAPSNAISELISE